MRLLPRSALLSSVFLCLVVVFTPAPALRAQDGSQTFEEETSVTFVEVRVRVIRDGRSVEGLGPEHFEVFDEGTPRSLAGFDVLRRRTISTAPSSETAVTPRAFPPRRAQAPARRYLFLFDLAYSDGLSLSKAMTASRELLGTDFRPGDQGAVAFFSALRGLRLVAPPSGEPEELSRAFDLLEAMIGRLPTWAGSMYDELRKQEEETAAPGLGGALLATRAEIVAEAGILVRADPFWPHRSVIRGLARELAALPEAVEVLAAGREAPAPRLLDRPDSDLPDSDGARSEAAGPDAASPDAAGPDAAEPDSAGPALHPEAWEAGETHVLFLSRGFDPRYLTGRGSAGTLGELEDAFGVLRRRGWMIQGINIAGLRGLDGRETLFFLSHETGGESFENFNDMGEAFAAMLRHNEVIYTLAFRADDVPRDGRFRRLRVRLRDVPGRARVVHRPGYYAPAAPP